MESLQFQRIAVISWSSLIEEHLAPHDRLGRLGCQIVEIAKKLSDCGFDAFLLSNSKDSLHFVNQVPTMTILKMTMLAVVLKSVLSVPVGIEFVENEYQSSLCASAVAGVDWMNVSFFPYSGFNYNKNLMIALLKERARMHAPVAIRLTCCLNELKFLNSFINQKPCLIDSVILSNFHRIDPMTQENRMKYLSKIPFYLRLNSLTFSKSMLSLLANGLKWQGVFFDMKSIFDSNFDYQNVKKLILKFNQHLT